MADTGAFQHAAFLYRTRAEFTATVVDFVRAGIRAGEAALVASAAPAIQLLRANLGGEAEQVAWRDLSIMGMNPARITAAFRMFVDEHAGQAVRCVQELAWHAESPGVQRETLRHEALLNRALEHDRASLLCAYDTRLPSGVIAGATRTHPLVMRQGRWQASRGYASSPLIPAECGDPLPAPPATAARLSYRDDLTVVRRFAAAQAQRAGLGQERAADLVLAVSEVAANTLAHTTGPGTLSVWADEGEVVCQLRDSGRIGDPLAGTHPPGPEITGGGQGLWVVHQVCDLVEIRTGPDGTVIRLHVHLPG